MSSEINQILVPTDYSEYSSNAFSFAMEIAAHWNSVVTLVHVIQKPVDYTFPDRESAGHFMRHAERKLEEMAYHMEERKEFSEVQINTLIKVGNIVTAILDLAESDQYDLIVMGTKGVSGLKKRLFGSVTAQIVSNSPVPVMAVPANSNYTGFEWITFATDYRSGDWRAFKEILQWADRFNSELNVLHVSEKREMESDIKFRGFRDLISERTPEKHVAFDLVIKKKFLTGVADYLNDHPVSLLVLVRYPHSYIESLLTKDHTRQLAYYSKVPILMLPGEKVPARKH